MKKNSNIEYIAPEADVVFFKLEQGFAVSGNTEGFGNRDGEW